MTTTTPTKGGPAQPASVNTDGKTIGRVALRVYGFDTAADAVAAGFHSAEAGPAMSVYVVSDAELASGKYVLEGDPKATPIYTAPAGMKVEAGYSQPVFLVGGSLSLDWFVDSVGGSDSNTGKSTDQSFKTIAKLLTVLQGGQSVGLAKGSHWREQLTLSNSSNSISAYGTGANPILDAADIITGWSKTGGLTNVYEKSVVTAAALGEQFINVWEDDAPMHRVASAAACDGAAGSSYVTGASGTVTVYIHPVASDDPASNGKTYEVSTRNAGLYATTSGHTINGITTQKNQSASGSLIVSRSSIITDCICKMGSKHNLYTSDGCTLNNVECIDQYYNDQCTLFVYNENTPAGLGVTYNNCSASRPNTALITGNSLGTGFYGHVNTSGTFGTITYNNCSVEDCFTGYNGQDAANFIYNNCTNLDSTNCFANASGTGISTFAIHGGTYVCTSSVLLIQAGGNSTITIDSGASLSDPASNQYAINVQVPNLTLNLDHCAISSRFGYVGTTAPATGFILNVNYLDSTVAFNYAGHINTVVATTIYTGDHNTYRTSQINVVNGSTYATLAALRAALNQDLNSTFVP